MRSFRIAFWLLLIATLSSGMLPAQVTTRGTIAGVVEDSSGAVVPNSKVTLSGPFGNQEVTTDERGTFQFANLNPGQYILRAELTGFRPAEARNVNVRLSEQTFVRLVLEPGEVTQTVEVRADAESPIDETKTSVSTAISDQLIQSVPIARNLSEVVKIAPGVSEGLGTGAQNPSVSGATGFENLTTVDGVNITNPEFGAVGSYNRVHGALGTGMNFDFIKEVEVKTGGFEAQYGQALGGVFNVATKSGSNDIHGGIYAYAAPNAFEATRKQPNAVLNNPRTEFRGTGGYDLTGELGGRLIQDKLFWYGALNPVLRLNDIRAPLGFDLRSRGTIIEEQRGLNQTGKLTWQPARDHQIEGSYFADPSQMNHGPHVNLARNSFSGDLGEADSRLRFGNRNVIARYNGSFGARLVTTISGGRTFNKFDETNFANLYQIEDLVPATLGTGPRVLSGGLGFFENTRMANNQFNIVNAVNFDLLGKNQFEFGYNLEDVKTDSYSARSGPLWTIFAGPSFVRPEDVGKPVFGADIRRRFISDTSSPIVFQQFRGAFSPSPPITHTNTRYHAAFVQDNFSLSRYFMVKAGVRWEQQELHGDPRTTGNDPNTHHTFTGNWAPRVGFTIDPTGRNRSKLYFNYGLFFEKIPLDLAVRSLSVEGSYLGLRFSQPVLTVANYVSGGFLNSGEVTQIFPGTKSQYQREFVAGIEHTLTDYNIVLGARFIRRDLQRIVEDMSGITVEQAISDTPPEQVYVIGNPSSRLDIFKNPICTDPPACTSFTGGGIGSDGRPDGFPDPTRRYWAWEFTSEKRFEEVWQMQASYRYSSLRGNYEGLFRNDNLQNDPNITSLFDFIASPALADQFAVGLLPTDRKHQGKFYLSHSFPEYGFNLGIGTTTASGTPISRFKAHPAYLNPGEIPVGGRGAAGRTAVITSIDGHVDYTWNISERVRLRPNLDVFNILNQQHIQRVVQDIELAPGVPNTDFNKPLPYTTARTFGGYQRPLYVRVALRLEF